MALNRIVLQGRLTATPELRHTQQGTPVTTVTLAVDRDRKEQDGSRGCDFIEVNAWSGTAELIANYFTKGRMMLVDGRLVMRDWTDREGNKRRTAQVVANSVYFCDSKREGNSEPAYSQTAYQRPTPGQFEDYDDDSDIPF